MIITSRIDFFTKSEKNESKSRLPKACFHHTFFQRASLEASIYCGDCIGSVCLNRLSIVALF